jgi:hypothetical protein
LVCTIAIDLDAITLSKQHEILIGIDQRFQIRFASIGVHRPHIDRAAKRGQLSRGGVVDAHDHGLRLCERCGRNDLPWLKADDGSRTQHNGQQASDEETSQHGAILWSERAPGKAVFAGTLSLVKHHYFKIK